MNVAEEVVRFAELAARTGLEPDLARRLETEREAVLAEFGLPAGVAGGAGEEPVVESLSGAGVEPAGARWCTCWSPELPVLRGE
ncbi:hypothetical protein ACPCIX_16240 [Streptomyces pseudogriseolus]|uniref:Uncharacterized protein n=1 Tax=Streptomyces gancidicus BKS 13-15 TaxID=1284664 RepID=M3EAM1_STREZ|nr:MULTISPECIES: hypothetical protein [Streptomyces]EMF30196.1 hypothetical protein H114_05118 [Streptomyces gancidicus BKS 13-15]